MAAGFDYCGLVKKIHKDFCLATFENSMKDWSEGSYLVTKSTPRVPVVRPLLAIGYKYNYRKVLVFIAAEGAGSNEPVYPYLYSFTDIYYNVSVRPVANPHLLDRYFNSCNAI